MLPVLGQGRQGGTPWA